MRIKLKVLLIFVCCIFIYSCNRKKQEDVKINYLSNGKINELIFHNNDNSIEYKIKINEQGNIDSMRLIYKDTTNIKFSFYKNGSLETYSKTKNSIYQNTFVEFDSLSNISEVDITNKAEGSYYLNQILVFNQYGLISANKSYYLQIQDYDIGSNKIEMHITLVGKKTKIVWL